MLERQQSKAKVHPTLASHVTDASDLFVKGDEGRETIELFTKLDTWDKDRRFVVSCVLKPEQERAQLSLLDGAEYEYFFFVTNTALLSEKIVIMKLSENYPHKAAYEQCLI